MSGLPPKLMSIAVGTAWIMAVIPGISFAAAAGITLSIAWFIFKLFR